MRPRKCTFQFRLFMLPGNFHSYKVVISVSDPVENVVHLCDLRPYSHYHLLLRSKSRNSGAVPRLYSSLNFSTSGESLRNQARLKKKDKTPQWWIPTAWSCRLRLSFPAFRPTKSSSSWLFSSFGPGRSTSSSTSGVRHLSFLLTNKTVQHSSLLSNAASLSIAQC